MQSNLKWMNATFLKALKDRVESGTLVKVRGSFKLSKVTKDGLKKKVCFCTLYI